MITGATGLVGGNGVINANVTNFGIINPGNTPGKLTINGAFDSDQGKIVLEVQSLGNGQFAVDQLVFGDPTQVNIGNADIEFHFLDGTDPTDFLNAGLFQLATFFKEGDGHGGELDLADANRIWFSAADFSAVADSFTLLNFAFDPFSGATFSVLQVPVPATLLLVLLALDAWPARAGAAECRPACGQAEQGPQMRAIPVHGANMACKVCRVRAKGAGRDPALTDATITVRRWSFMTLKPSAPARPALSIPPPARLRSTRPSAR